MSQTNILYTLITGASQGLGKALAIECASRKMNLFLISLPGEGLSLLAKKIKANYCVDVKYYETDLTDRSSLMTLFEELQDISINVLINNAGLGGSFEIEKAPIKLIEAIILLNIHAPVFLCCKLLPQLRQHEHSYILNVSSIISQLPAAYKTVYPASKSFIFSFSRGLSEEMKRTSVNVSVLVPGGMITNRKVKIQMKGHGFLPRLSILDTRQVAAIAISGMLKGKKIIVPGFLNKISWILMHLIPQRLGIPLISRLNQHELKAGNS